MARRVSPLPIPVLECPLGDEHCEFLNQVLRSCADVKGMCDKLQSLGLDMTGWSEPSAANQRVAEGVKSIFFPDRH